MFGDLGQKLGRIILSQLMDRQFGSAQGMIARRGASEWTGLARSNDSATYLDGTGVYTQPSASGGTNWVTAIDLDFSAEANQTLSSDTTYSIGGVTWTKVNSSADRVAMAVVNGSGLVIQPNAGSSIYNGTSRTCPYLYADMASIIPGFYLDIPLRIWLYVSVDNITASGDGCGMSLDNLSTNTNTTSIFTVRRVNNGGTKSIEYNGVITGTSIAFIANSSLLDNSDRVLMWTLPVGRFNGLSTLHSGAYSSGFPAVTSMVPRGRGGVQSSIQQFTSSQDFITGLPIKLSLFAHRFTSTTLLSCTIARIRIDYKVQ